MVRGDPGQNFLPQPQGELPHLLRLALGYRARLLVVCNVPLLSEGVKQADSRSVGADRQFQRVNHAVVMIGPLRLITRGGKSGRGKLQRGIVGDIESPVGYQVGGLGSLNITIGDGEQVGDLLPACLVLLEPTVL